MRIPAIAAMSAPAQDHGPEAKMVNRLRDSKSPYVSIPSIETETETETEYRYRLTITGQGSHA